MYCKNCGKELKSENKFCPFCGAETGNMAEPVSSPDGQKKPKKKVWMVFPALLAAVCIAFGVYKAVNTTSENGAKEEWVTTVKEDGKWYVINGKNEKLAEIALDNILNIYNFNEYGVALVEVGQDITYINADGKVLVDPFEKFTDYWEGVDSPIESGDNWCCERGIFKVNEKEGFIDSEGKIIIPPIYDNVSEFGKNGLAPVKVDDLWGYIDTEGEMVIEPSYFTAGSFSDNGLAEVIPDNDNLCFINRDGEIVIDTGYNAFTSDYNVGAFDENGFAHVERDGMWGIMNGDGVIIAEPIYEWADACDKDSLRVCLEGKYGLIDAQGRMCIAPVYDKLWPLNEKFYAVCVNGSWGVVDRDGEEIVEPIYSYIDELGKKKWIGYSDYGTKLYLLNNDGTVAKTWESNEEFWYTNICNWELGGEKLLGVETNGKWIFVNDEGEIELKTKEKFEAIDPNINFTGSPVAVQNDNNWGYIDVNGKLMIDFQYEEVNSFFDKGSLDL